MQVFIKESLSLSTEKREEKDCIANRQWRISGVGSGPTVEVGCHSGARNDPWSPQGPEMGAGVRGVCGGGVEKG